MSKTYLFTIRQSGDRLLLCVVGVLLVMAFALAPLYDTWGEVFAIGAPTAGIVAWLVATRPGELVTRCTIAAALMIFTGLHIHPVQRPLRDFRPGRLPARDDERAQPTRGLGRVVCERFRRSPGGPGAW